MIIAIMSWYSTREVSSVADKGFTQHHRHVSQSAGQLVEYALPSWRFTGTPKKKKREMQHLIKIRIFS